MKKALILLLLWPTLALAQPRFDEPVKLKASEVLPLESLVGPNHKVEESVENDGFLNRYVLDSRWGQLEVTSTPMLEKRIAELNAMAEMEQLKGSKEFKKGVEQAAKKVVSGGKNLITDPGGSVKKLGKGVGGLFKSVGGAFSGKNKERGSTEGDTLERVSGFSKAKRQYAERFKVDPYSRNELLQHQLDEVSKAGFLGSTLTSMGLGKLGGRAVSVVGAVGDVDKLIHTQSPDRLREINREKLKEMKVDKEVADLFTRNTHFTITEQTTLVAALAEMQQVEERAEFIKFAVLTDSVELAGFRTVQAHLYSVYHQKWQKLERFLHFGEFSCAQAVDGTVVVVVAPVDRLLWTEELAEHIEALDRRIKDDNPEARRVLWVSGDFSPLAQTHLQNLGWVLRPRALEKIKD